MIDELCREAMIVFVCGMSAALSAGAALTVMIYKDARIDPIGAADRYGPMLEYIAMTVLIVVAGTVLFDIIDKKS